MDRALPLADRIPTRTVLLVTVGLIVTRWSVMVATNVVSLDAAAAALLPTTSAQGVDMSRLFSKLSYLPVWIAIALLKGGLVEELWRIFALARFEKTFGAAGLVFALIASSIVFGFGHLYQGAGAVAANAIEGALYAPVYLRRRSAWEPVFAHTVFDLIGITLGFVVYA